VVSQNDIEALQRQFTEAQDALFAVRKVAKSPSPFSQNLSTLEGVFGSVNLLVCVLRKGV